MTREQALEQARRSGQAERLCDSDCLHSKQCDSDFEERLLESIGWPGAEDLQNDDNG